MKPTLLSPAGIAAYLDAGHWTLDTMAGRCADHARDCPGRIACQDAQGTYTWAQLDAATDRLSANLIGLGLVRDSRALVQMPSSSREMLLRIALKKAGIIGVYVPMQWRRRELDYVMQRIAPDLIVMARDALHPDDMAWLDDAAAGLHARIDLGTPTAPGWRPWDELSTPSANADDIAQIPNRSFGFDDVSLITASSGTSGLAKLCEWPEAAQICVGRGIAVRLGLTADDNLGIFAPMSGAAGVLVWTISATLPCTFTYPENFQPASLLRLVEQSAITAATTVPVILARLAAENLTPFDLSSLRVLRVGTAATNVEAARSFEESSGCKVVVASGSMECPGFGHAHVGEPKTRRLDGSVGLPLPGCRLRVDDDAGQALPPGDIGEVKVSAPFAASGYWHDPAATEAAWSDGWYATGDIGCLDDDGRLTLIGRAKEVINRSGHKILPAEVEREIARHADVFECAVVAAPDEEYGQVAWAYVQPHPGASVDAKALTALLQERGLAGYKIPARIIEVRELPRVGGGKVDKKALVAGNGSVVKP
ncbi:MAG: long-chain fatty acid--CoA ligase [Rhodospirillaceae bacterium]|nr:long-chain fatty acid--CoA ligase [Rhodospirillaceae bacterium]